MKQRNSNLELYRILCILGITMHHMVYHTDALYSNNIFVRVCSQFFNMFGQGGGKWFYFNNFVLLDGWGELFEKSISIS